MLEFPRHCVAFDGSVRHTLRLLRTRRLLLPINHRASAREIPDRGKIVDGLCLRYGRRHLLNKPEKDATRLDQRVIVASEWHYAPFPYASRTGLRSAPAHLIRPHRSGRRGWTHVSGREPA